MFSDRLQSLEENELWQRLQRRRAAGDAVVDLTESNPTRVGLTYPNAAILGALAAPGALVYDPTPHGHLAAREAVSRYYFDRGARLTPDDVVLTASTSEAYGFLFKLLCNPGDGVLVPRPSYPLFESLARLEAVEPVPYSLAHGPESPLPRRCRAIVVVHPNNPTGAYVTDERRETLLELSEAHDVALIVDEVFLDYPIGRAAAPSFAGSRRGLVLTLSGLSKLAGLPQMKLAWIGLSGARARVNDARRRLEHIADAFLSVGTPAQLGAPRWLELAGSIRARIQDRVQGNLSTLEQVVASVPEATLPPPEAGWYAALRLPGIASPEAWALDVLERASVYLHPGNLFGFEESSYVVVSLLPAPRVFGPAVERVLGVVSDRVHSPGA